VFSMLDALLLRVLPVPQSERLVLFSIDAPAGNDDSFSFPDFVQYRDESRVFTGVCASGGTNTARARLDASPGVESVRAEKVSGNFFSVLGIAAAAGRFMTDDDDRPGDPRPVAVLSDRFWKRRFARDPGVVGRTIALNDVPLTIIGVAPARFFGIEI